MRATCHRASVQRRYCSGFLSLSHISVMLLWMVAAFLPLLLAMGSRDFVLRESSYREQPVVGLTDRMLCIFEGERDDGGQKQPLMLVHSTFSERVQQLYSNDSLRSASIQTSSMDNNLDGTAESVHVEFSMPLSTNETIRMATLIVVLNYTLKSYTKLNMDVLAMYWHSSPFAGDTLYADGDLDLHQRNALDITNSMQRPYIHSSIANMIKNDTTQEHLLQSLVSGYRERNYTANFHVPYPIWTSNANSEDIRLFRVFMDIQINSVDILYTPEWPEIVKYAWIQYYCIFIVVSTLAIALREYLFTHKLLPSVCVIDEPRLKSAAKFE